MKGFVDTNVIPRMRKHISNKRFLNDIFLSSYRSTCILRVYIRNERSKFQEFRLFSLLKDTVSKIDRFEDTSRRFYFHESIHYPFLKILIPESHQTFHFPSILSILFKHNVLSIPLSRYIF